MMSVPITRWPLAAIAVLCLAVLTPHAAWAEDIATYQYSVWERSFMKSDFERVERQYPAGTFVYVCDLFQVVDGDDSLQTFADVTFFRDAAGALTVADMASGDVIMRYSKRAKVAKKIAGTELFVRPGEEMDDVLSFLVSIGGARLSKVL